MWDGMRGPTIGLAVGVLCLGAVAHDALAGSNERTSAPELRADLKRSSLEPGLSGAFSTQSSSIPPGRHRFWPLILREAQSHQLPASIADAVVRIESSY